MRAKPETQVTREIERANLNIGNETLKPEFFHPLSTDKGEFENIGTEFSNCFYIFNLTDNPICYIRQDGIVVPLKENNVGSMLTRDQIERFAGHILVIQTRSVDLTFFDSEIGALDYANDRVHLNYEGAQRYTDFISATGESSQYDFLYQVDMENAIALKIKEHRASRYAGTGDETEMAPVYERCDTIVKTMVAYAIHQDGLQTAVDTYISELDIVVRVLDTYMEEGVTRFRKKVRRVVPKNYPMRHPMFRVNAVDMLRNMNESTAANCHTEAIKIRIWRSRTDKELMFLVRNNRIIELPLELLSDRDQEGIFVTEKDENGVFKTTVYPFTEMEMFSLYWLHDEATFALNREKISVQADKAKVEAAEAETKAKKESTEEKQREAWVNRDKNNTSIKSDVLRLAGQVFSLIAGVATAVVALVKVFATSKFSHSLIRAMT